MVISLRRSGEVGLGLVTRVHASQCAMVKQVLCIKFRFRSPMEEFAKRSRGQPSAGHWFEGTAGSTMQQMVSSRIREDRGFLLCEGPLY